MNRHIVRNCTDEEISILRREGFCFCLCDLNAESGDIMIFGDKNYFKMALHAIRRI